jgi:hypothetical protein
MVAKFAKQAQKNKMEKVMHEWKKGKLHSGTKKGPKVTSQKQAVAIALSEAKKVAKIPKPKICAKKPKHMFGGF